MRKESIFLLVIAVAILLGSAVAFGSNTAKAGNLNVELSFHKAALMVGENNVGISIRDEEGNLVNNLKVKVEYGMSSMKNMPPMEYTVRAKTGDESYNAMINISMGGRWYVNVKILTADGQIQAASFSFNVKNSGMKMMH